MNQIKFSSKVAYHGAKGHNNNCLAHKACLYSLEGKTLVSMPVNTNVGVPTEE